MKQFILNRRHEKICVLVEGKENSRTHRLVFLQHGWGGYKEQAVIRALAKAFISAGYVVVSIDSRNSFGESDGCLQDTTLTGFIDDLSEVISWAKNQDFYIEPFCLCGHSLGGGSILKYAEDNPTQVERLVAVSPMVGGKYFERSRRLNFAKAYENWQKTGLLYKERKDKPEINGYISFETVKDMLKYDMVAEADKIACPVLVVTGGKDLSSTVYNNEQLLSKIKTAKEFEVIADSAHMFEAPNEQQNLSAVVTKWLIGKVD